METALGALRDAVRANDLPIELIRGGEIAHERLLDLDESELARFTLGATSYLLVEFPYDHWPPTLADALRRATSLGLRPVLAHPERNQAVQRAPGRLAAMVAEGVLLQVTAPSVEGSLGRSASRAAAELIDLGLVHLMSSDTHGFSFRPYALRAACSALRDRELADQLTRANPAALVRGDSVLPTGRRPRRRAPRLWATLKPRW